MLPFSCVSTPRGLNWRHLRTVFHPVTGSQARRFLCARPFLALSFLIVATYPACANDFSILALGNFGTDQDGNSFSSALRINNRGQVVGTSGVYDASHNFLGTAAFLYDQGTLTNLGNFGSNASGAGQAVPNGINNSGKVVGSSQVHDDNHIFKGYAAFLYDQGTLTNLGNFGTDSSGSGFSFGGSINASGQIAGTSNVYDANHNYKGQAAFLYDQGTLTNLGNFGTDANGFGNSGGGFINASGQIAGSSDLYDANHNYTGKAAFLYDKGTLINVGRFGTNPNGISASEARALNDAGQVVGVASAWDANHNFQGDTAFLYDHGTLISLGNFGTDIDGVGLSEAVAINSSGLIAGTSDVYDVYHVSKGHAAFLYDHGTLLNLGNLGTDILGNGYSQTLDINEIGQIIGVSTLYDANHAFVEDRPFFYSGGVLYDLYSLLPQNSGWSNLTLFDLNDVGQIVGYGLYNGQTTAFVISPNAVPEGDPIALLAGLFSVGGLYLRHTRCRL